MSRGVYVPKIDFGSRASQRAVAIHLLKTEERISAIERTMPEEEQYDGLDELLKIWADFKADMAEMAPHEDPMDYF